MSSPQQPQWPAYGQPGSGQPQPGPAPYGPPPGQSAYPAYGQPPMAQQGYGPSGYGPTPVGYGAMQPAPGHPGPARMPMPAPGALTAPPMWALWPLAEGPYGANVLAYNQPVDPRPNNALRIWRRVLWVLFALLLIVAIFAGQIVAGVFAVILFVVLLIMSRSGSRHERRRRS